MINVKVKNSVILVMWWRIDVLVVVGIDIVVRFRFIGFCFFIVICLFCLFRSLFICFFKFIKMNFDGII